GVHNLLRARSDTGRIAIHAENKRSDRVDAAIGQTIECELIIRRFVEAFIDRIETGGINRFQSDENPSSTACSNKIDEFFVLQEIDADLCNPWHGCALSNHLPEQ